MIIVNNGIGDLQFHTLNHSKWNGLTICDLVFPFFLFMVGVSAYYATSSRRADLSSICSILQRTVKFFLIGMALHAWEMLLDNPSLLTSPMALLGSLRVWGVLQRIAICYDVVSCTLLFIKDIRRILTIATILLAAYTVILILGNGYVEDASNILCIIDRAVFGIAHLYHKSPIDPEGLVATISSLAHVFIGAAVGFMFKSGAASNIRKMMPGLASLAIGIGLSIFLPINKRIWSPSYVFVTCGLATIVLATLAFIERTPLYRTALVNRPADYFRRLGLHAFAAYILSEMIAPLVGHLGVNKILFSMMTSVTTPQLASFIYSLLFTLLVCTPLVVMHKGKR